LRLHFPGTRSTQRVPSNPHPCSAAELAPEFEPDEERLQEVESPGMTGELRGVNLAELEPVRTERLLIVPMSLAGVTIQP
jgi:hypothetical protein